MEEIILESQLALLGVEKHFTVSSYNYFPMYIFLEDN